MKGYVVTVKFDINHKYFEDFLELIISNAKHSIREDGCIQFDIAIRDKEVFLYEVYKSGEDFEIHLETEHYKGFQQKASKYIIEKRIETYMLV